MKIDGTTHNLTEFILEYELPRSLATRGKSGKQIDILAIHLHPDNFKNSNEESSGIDYVRFGALRIKAFNHLIKRGFLPKKEIQRLKNLVVSQMKAARPFLQVCADYNMDKLSNKEFVKLFQITLNLVTSLRTVYFETLLEYVLLFQNDSIALRYKANGELYNWHHKKMIFELCPVLFKSFKLTYFNPPLGQIVEYLRKKSKQKKIICDFSEKQFLEFMKWRIAQYVRYKILDGKNPPAGNFTFGKIVSQNPSFAGHVIHRKIKWIHEYEKEMARELWHYWNKNKILCLVHSIAPKGEMDINPAFPNLKHTIFKVDINPTTKKINRREKTAIKITPRLINPELGVMRAPHA